MGKWTRLEAGRGALDRLAVGPASWLLPFYRRHPYGGPLGLFDVDPRGAFSPVDGFFYNRVPKAANSTVMAALAERSKFFDRWGRSRIKSQFLRPSRMSIRDVERLDVDVFRFTFVRDPYSRVLSAYRDKVGHGRRQSGRFSIWLRGREPTFRAFLHYLADGGLHHDPHWAPQTSLLLLPIERFDLVGRVERLESDLAIVLERIWGERVTEAPRQRGPRTGSNAMVDSHYGREEVALVNQLYVTDLQTLGYPIRAC